MAIVDSHLILADHQEVTATTLSQRCVDMQAYGDYGVGHNAYVQTVMQGDMSTDLRVQILGSEDETFANPILLGDSGVYKQAQLVNGATFFTRLNETGEKWRYVCVRFIPTTADGKSSEEVTGGVAYEQTGAFAPVSKVGEEVTPKANNVRAQVVFVAALGTLYPYANSDKVTA